MISEGVILTPNIKISKVNPLWMPLDFHPFTDRDQIRPQVEICPWKTRLATLCADNTDNWISWEPCELQSASVVLMRVNSRGRIMKGMLLYNVPLASLTFDSKVWIFEVCNAQFPILCPRYKMSGLGLIFAFTATLEKEKRGIALPEI